MSKKSLFIRDYLHKQALQMIKYDINVQRILDFQLEKIHLSRKKFISAFVMGMLETKSVKFQDIAEVLNDEAKVASNHRRIQTFFAQYELEYLAYARLLMGFVPHRLLDISIDRTNWKFGDTDINILCLTVNFKGVGIPILFELLDKKGNSNQEERIELMDKFISLFPTSRIGSLTADREFIGDKWYKYLILNKIPFYLRLPKSHRITLNGIHYRIDVLIDSYVKKGEKQLANIEEHGIGGLHIGLRKLYANGKTRLEDDYLAVLTNQAHTNALYVYKKRWSIETFFQSIKKRGFDIEQTHLDEGVRLKKLFALVALAFVISLTVGLKHDENVKSIEVKNHGYKQFSFFRVGLDKISKAIKRRFFDKQKITDILHNVFRHVAKISAAWCLDKNIIT